MATPLGSQLNTFDLETVTNTAGLNALLTTRGDVLVKGASNVQRLAVGTNGQVLTTDGTDVSWGAASGGTNLVSTNDFRLTLESGVPVSTSDQTAKATLYLTPYVGNQIALYNGAAWAALSSAEVSISLASITTGKPYDVFAYNNSGTLTLELLAWTNNTTRATALVRQDGVWCKTGVLTRRYVGTIYPSGAGTCEDSLTKRYVWNTNNRVVRGVTYSTGSASHSYSGGWRAWNNVTTHRVEYVVGLAEDGRFIVVGHQFTPPSSVSAYVGIYIDGVLSNSIGDAITVSHDIERTDTTRTPAVGYHYEYLGEASSGGSTTFDYGNIFGFVVA